LHRLAHLHLQISACFTVTPKSLLSRADNPFLVFNIKEIARNH
jgi:hypothetical protein